MNNEIRMHNMRSLSPAETQERISTLPVNITTQVTQAITSTTSLAKLHQLSGCRKRCLLFPGTTSNALATQIRHTGPSYTVHISKYGRKEGSTQAHTTSLHSIKITERPFLTFFISFSIHYSFSLRTFSDSLCLKI